jgi:hypothetical protein
MLRLMSLKLVLLLCACTVHAEEPLKIGSRAPMSIVGHFVSGPILEQQSEICPTLYERDECKIAIFTRSINDSQRNLVASLNTLVKNEPRLKWSFWMVSHENNPTPDDASWEQMLSDLKKFAEDRNVDAISTGALIRIPDKKQVTRAMKSIGVFRGKNDTVVMLIVPDEKKQRGLIQYAQEVDSSELTAEMITTIQAELKGALR